MNMALFQQELNSIDEDYPLSIPPCTILAVQIIMGVTLLMALLIAIWQVCKRKKNLSTQGGSGNQGFGYEQFWQVCELSKIVTFQLQ